MKTWRCAAQVHAWEGDAGQVSVSPGPLRLTVEWSTSPLGWFSPFSFFCLPTALGHARGELMGTEAQGKLSFACHHPHSASVAAITAQQQASSAEILPQNSPEVLRHTCPMYMHSLGQQSLPALLRKESLLQLHKELFEKHEKMREGERGFTGLVGAREAYTLQLIKGPATPE